MAVHPLRPANHHRLGRPLPHQLANSTQAHLSATAKRPSFSFSRTYAVLTSISRGYSSLKGRFLRVTHPFAALLSPKTFLARLACVKHAASVYSEPGSNSPSQKLLIASDHKIKAFFRIFRIFQRIIYQIFYVNWEI